MENLNYIEKNGKKEYVIIPYNEFMEIKERLADYKDLRDLRKANADEGDAPNVGLEEAKKRLGVE
jgi:hypothetical protein